MRYCACSVSSAAMRSGSGAPWCRLAGTVVEMGLSTASRHCEGVCCGRRVYHLRALTTTLSLTECYRGEGMRVVRDRPPLSQAHLRRVTPPLALRCVVRLQQRLPGQSPESEHLPPSPSGFVSPTRSRVLGS